MNSFDYIDIYWNLVEIWLSCTSAYADQSGVESPFVFSKKRLYASDEFDESL